MPAKIEHVRRIDRVETVTVRCWPICLSPSVGMLLSLAEAYLRLDDLNTLLTVRTSPRQYISLLVALQVVRFASASASREKPRWLPRKGMLLHWGRRS